MLRQQQLCNRGLRQHSQGGILVRHANLPSVGRKPMCCTAALLPTSVESAPAALMEPAAASSSFLADHARAAEQMLYTLAASPDVAAVVADPAKVKRAGGWLEPLSDALEKVLRFFQTGLDAAHVPYSYGFSIILLTLCVKIATFPLTRQQIESSMAVQSLKPRIDLIKKRFGEDKDKISKETNILYEQAGVNPLAGCLPTLATIPIFIGLYSSLTNAASDGLFDTEGFFWLPSLAGPTTIAARQSGSGTAWLFPFVDGAPPIGWDEAVRYCTLPVLLVLSQYLSTAIVSPPIDKDDPNANTSRALQIFLPLMIGYFSLNVPSGLSLYYFSNSVLTTAVQIYLKKLGGARIVMNELGPVTKPGSGRRTGVAVTAFEPWTPVTVTINPKPAEEEQEDSSSSSSSAADPEAAGGTALAAEAAPAMLDAASVSHRVKRKRMSLILEQQKPKLQPAVVAAVADGHAAAAAAAGSNGMA